MTTPALQQTDLNQFTGTQTYYRHALNRKVTYTDGVKYFADRAGAHWLIDILATELERLARKHGILFITAKARDGKADLEALPDHGKPPLWSRHISLTDLPEGDWRLWMADGAPEGTVVIMLPSEY